MGKITSDGFIYRLVHQATVLDTNFKYLLFQYFLVRNCFVSLSTIARERMTGDDEEMEKEKMKIDVKCRERPPIKSVLPRPEVERILSARHEMQKTTSLKSPFKCRR